MGFNSGFKGLNKLSSCRKNVSGLTIWRDLQVLLCGKMSISQRYLGTVQVLWNKMSVMKQHKKNCWFLYRSTAGRLRAKMVLGVRLRMTVLSVMGNITLWFVTSKVLSLSATMFSSQWGRRISLNCKWKSSVLFTHCLRYLKHWNLFHIQNSCFPNSSI